MKTLIYIAIMVFLFIIQTTVISVFQVTDINPDLPLIFSLCLVLIENERIGSGLGLLNGMLEDIFYGRLLGFNAMVKFSTNCILGYFSKSIYRGPAIITMGLVFFSTIIYNLLLAILSFLTGTFVKSWSFFVPIALKSAVFNMILSPFIYRWTLKLVRFFNYYFDTRY